MAKTLHFKNKKSYRKWLAYGHMHHEFDVPGNKRIYIHGKLHKVKHKKKK